jgi:uncharacterized protein (TIGR03435 family)
MKDRGFGVVVLMAVLVHGALSQTSTTQGGSAAAQSASAVTKLPEFDVATVKPAELSPVTFVGLFTYPGGRIVVRYYTLKMLIQDALNVRDWQIVGGPNWIDDARYDIEAKPPVSSPSIHSTPANPKFPPNDEQRQMMQSLLIDRFQLKFHRAIRQGPVYLLQKGNKDLKLQTPKDKDSEPWAGGIEGGAISRGTGIAGSNITMPLLAQRLSRYLGRPVIDQTGLQGSYDFEYRTGDDDANFDITYAIRSSLQGIGLKLVPSQGSVETIMIDHAEKPSAD